MISRERAHSYTFRRKPLVDSEFTLYLTLLAVLFFLLGILADAFRRYPAVEHPRSNPSFVIEDSVSRRGHANTWSTIDGSSTSSVWDVQLEQAIIKPKLKLFTVPSGVFGKYAKRRAAIRDSYLPVLENLSETRAQFVAGYSTVRGHNWALDIEETAFPDSFMRLNMTVCFYYLTLCRFSCMVFPPLWSEAEALRECYSCLPEKTVKFFLRVRELYDAEWIMKIDDDVYLSPQRLPVATQQWSTISADYVGCSVYGDVHTDSNHRWFEPAWSLLAGNGLSHLYQFGSAYAVSAHAAASVLAHNAHNLRALSSEDMSMGMWMLAFNTTFFEDRRLCSPKCHPSALAYSSDKCSGLCHAVRDMRSMHSTENCTMPLEPSPSSTSSGSTSISSVLLPVPDENEAGDPSGVLDLKNHLEFFPGGVHHGGPHRHRFDHLQSGKAFSEVYPEVQSVI